MYVTSEITRRFNKNDIYTSHKGICREKKIEEQVEEEGEKQEIRINGFCFCASFRYQLKTANKKPYNLNAILNSLEKCSW